MPSLISMRTPWRSPMVRLAICSALITSPASVVFAAQTFVEPQVEARVEYNDNFGLVPDGDDTEATGYIADASALIGIATPRSETSLRPRLRLQEYSNVGDDASSRKITPVEAFLDLRSQFETQRSKVLVDGRYSHQDSYSAETPSGDDDVDSDSGNIEIGETRDFFSLRPSFSYAMSERMRVGAGLDYQMARYDSDGVQTRVDYNYGVLDGSLTRILSPLSEASIGAYVSRFEAKDDSSETDAYGAEIGYNYRWSETTGLESSLFFERNETTNFDPITVEESTDGWGGTLTGYRKSEVSEWRASIGRRFIPTGDGDKAEVDMLRVQYDRDLSERLSFRGAGRYEKRNAITEFDVGDDRDYARADFSLDWFMRPTWYLTGGYSYIWQDKEQAVGDADNNKLFIGIGYRALRHAAR